MSQRLAEIFRCLRSLTARLVDGSLGDSGIDDLRADELTSFLSIHVYSHLTSSPACDEQKAPAE
jgi:hypothetical protein